MFPTEESHLFYSLSISRLSTCVPVYMYTAHMCVCLVLIPVTVRLLSAPVQHTF